MAPFVQAADRLFQTEPSFLAATDDYSAAGCMALQLHVGEVVAGWEWDGVGEGDDADRAALAVDLVRAVIREHQGMIAGLAAHPNRHQWHGVDWLPFVAAGGEDAQLWLAAVFRAQAVVVELRGRQVAVPARPALARLPPGHVQVVFRGVPFYYTRPGFTEAILDAGAWVCP